MAASRFFRIIDSTSVRRWLSLTVLATLALPLVAQDGRQPLGRVTAKVDDSALPNAPMPAPSAVAAGSSGVDLSFSTVTSLDLQQSPLQNPQKPGTTPSLQDLGMSPDQSKPDPDMQARLDRRTHDLKVHQRLGLITLAPLAAACISSASAPPDPRNGQGNTIGRDIHVSLGSLSVAMYGATAYYAIKAPRIPGEGPSKGGIKLHKYLIYIHAPGMILTPILGAIAFNQAADGQRVHGIASAHAAVAWTTVAAYSAAIVAVSWPIHLPGRKTP